MTDVFWISKMVAVEWRLTDLDGAPVTDATVTGLITLPDGTTAAAVVDHPSGTNIYRALYDPTSAGTHAYRLQASGTVDDADEGTFDVRPSPDVAPPPTIDPATSIGMVRLLIPDRDVANLLFADVDLAAFLALEGAVVKLAAASALETVASNEAMVSKVIRSQDLATDGAKVSDALMKRATELRRQADQDDPDSSGNLDVIDFVDPFIRRYPAEAAEIEWGCG
jgi:hypothetical protein